MKKVLILGGSHRDIPLIKAAKKLGYYVVTLGDRAYYIGHRYADNYYKINFNDLSEVKRVIENEKIDYLIPGSGEESYLNTVRLSHQLNIGNFDDIKTAKLVHNKWRFKEFCIANEITTPYGVYYTSDLNLNELSYPLVVKPTNLSGGRGVVVVYDEDELKKAIENREDILGEIFLEEYIEGELYAYSIFVKDQKIHYGFLGKDDMYLNKYLVTTAYPAVFNDTTMKRLNSDIEKIIKKFSLVDGMFHLQVMLKEDRAYIIDVTRRIPGDLYPYLIEYCDGVRYSEAVVKAYIGQPIGDELESKETKSFVIRHCVMADKNGILDDIYIDEKIKPYMIERLDLLQSGSHIQNYLSTQISIVFIKLDETGMKIAKHINQYIYPVICIN